MKRAHQIIGGGGANSTKFNSNSPINFSYKLQSLIFVALIPTLSFAGTGLDKVDTFLENVSNWLSNAGVVILTIAIMVAGYKVIFGGRTVQEVTPIVLGGILVGGASFIAGMLL